MAFTSSFFSGILDNTNIEELSKIMDRNLSSYKERYEHINGVLEDTLFFIEYFDDYYNVEKNKDEPLALDDNVCQLLENYGSYLLNAHDVEREEETKYKFYYNERDFQRALRKEINYEAGATDEVIDFLLDSQDNFKKSKEQKIFQKDLNREDFLGSVLRDYNRYIEILNESSLPLFRKNKLKGEIQRDMLLAKDQLLGVHGYKLRYFSESTQPSLEVIDFSNRKHLEGFSLDDKDKNKRAVKGLLDLKFNGDFQNDFQCILYDLDILIRKTTLTSNERKILNMVRDGGKLVDIAEDLNYTKQYIQQTLSSAVKKVCNTSKELNYKMF